MSGFTLLCDCGQSMSVPETAVGRTGLCPACGKEISITREKLRAPAPSPRGGGLLSRSRTLQTVTNNENREESWRKFAVAVDLYNNKRYAEALTLLSGLQQVFPGNPNIEAAVTQCADALKEAASTTLQYEGETVAETVLSEELIKGVILKKMLHGGTEDIQLKAAELAARVLGLLDAPMPAATPAQPRPDVAPMIFAQETPPAPGVNGNASSAKSAKRKRAVEEIP